MMNTPFLLASASPRRRQLFEMMGWPFDVLSVEVDERPLPAEAPKIYVQRMAAEKAEYAAAKSGDETIILSADTTVVHRGEILGKPADAREATLMLRRLRAKSHQVYTAIAIVAPALESPRIDICCTEVPMRDYSEEELLAYVSSGDPLDKAGAYAIQHPGFHPVENMHGCYANVMGLPLCHLTRTFLSLGIVPLVDVPQACQSAIGYRCEVYETILHGG
jgi:MAF protein